MRTPGPDAGFNLLTHGAFAVGMGIGMAIGIFGLHANIWTLAAIFLVGFLHRHLVWKWWDAHLISRRGAKVPRSISLPEGTALFKPDGSIVAVGPKVVTEFGVDWKLGPVEKRGQKLTFPIGTEFTMKNGETIKTQYLMVIDVSPEMIMSKHGPIPSYGMEAQLRRKGRQE